MNLLSKPKTTRELQLFLDVFLRYFHIEVDGFFIQPTEVEAYLCSEEYKDCYVHCNELQAGRLGKLYVHRASKSASGRPKGWAGIDVCLSDEDGVFFGVLIRSAYVNGRLVVGPYNLYCTLKEGKGPDYYKDVLEKEVVLKENLSADGKVFYSKRVGLVRNEEDNDGFIDRPLRAVLAATLIGTKYKMKEELFLGYKELHPEASSVELLGYRK